MMKRVIWSALGALLLVACSGNKQHEVAPQPIVNLHAFLKDYKSKNDEEKTIAIGQDFTELVAFFKTISDKPFSSTLLEDYYSSPGAMWLDIEAVDTLYNNIAPLEQALGVILQNAKDANLNIPLRRYAVVSSGKPQSIIFVDSVMMVFLNHYAGANFEGYSHLPTYLRTTKNKKHLPYDMAEALVGTSYPFVSTSSQATLLSYMLYEGALTKAKMELVEDASLAEALAYSDDELEWLKANESKIWEYIVNHGDLYSISPTVIKKYIAPSPGIRMGSVDVPQRVGRYIGYRIVESYLKKSDVQLETLLSPDFYLSEATLPQSNYAP